MKLWVALGQHHELEQTDWIAFFKFKVTVRVQLLWKKNNNNNFTTPSELLNFFFLQANLVWLCIIIISQSVAEKGEKLSSVPWSKWRFPASVLVHHVSAKPLGFFLPNLVCCCIINDPVPSGLSCHGPSEMLGSPALVHCTGGHVCMVRWTGGHVYMVCW